MDSLQFICPKDFKNGKYIFSKYRAIDLVILIAEGIIGLLISLVLLQIALSIRSLAIAIASIFLGGLIIVLSFILVQKVSYYHNVLEWCLVWIEYLTRKKRYMWKGIFYKDEDII